MSWRPLLVVALTVARAVLTPTSPIAHVTEVVCAGESPTSRSLRRVDQQVRLERGDEDVHIESNHSATEGSNRNPTLEAQTTGTETAEITIRREQSFEFELFPISDRDWFGAEAECEEWGGHLAVPRSPAGLREMTDLLLRHNRLTGENSAAFLGFSDLEEEGRFLTVAGHAMFSSDKAVWSPHWFSAGQPDDDKSWTREGEDCGSLMPSGGLNDVPCRYKLPFICERSQDRRKHDDNNDEDDDDGTLLLSSQYAKSWFEAREACQAWGGHLAVPDSKTKVLKMARILNSSHRNPECLCAFLGFSDIEKEGEFVTIYGKPVFDSNASWNPSWFSDSQPDDNKDWNEAGEDCGSLHPSGGLNDVPCQYHLPYFCDKSR